LCGFPHKITRRQGGLASLGYRGASTMVCVAALRPRRAASFALVATGADVEARREPNIAK